MRRIVFMVFMFMALLSLARNAHAAGMNTADDTLSLPIGAGGHTVMTVTPGSPPAGTTPKAVGIGTTTPTATLDVNGDVLIEGGTTGALNGASADTANKLRDLSPCDSGYALTKTASGFSCVEGSGVADKTCDPGQSVIGFASGAPVCGTNPGTACAAFVDAFSNPIPGLPDGGLYVSVNPPGGNCTMYQCRNGAIVSSGGWPCISGPRP
jgi:hypothetical protein